MKNWCEYSGYPGSIRVAAALLLLVLFVSAQQTGCRRRTPLSDSIVPATTARSGRFLLDRLEDNMPKQLESLKIRLKIYAENDGMATEAYANLIWIRDSALWLNIKKLGIEAARVLVTPDSMVVLNRLDKTVYTQNMEAVQREYSLPDGFPFLQALVLATAWRAPDIDLQPDIRDSLHRLSGTNGRFSADYRIEEKTFLLRQEIFVQPKDARTLSLLFAQFEKLPDAGRFPYFRRIELYSPESGAMRLDVELSDVEVNVPKSFRFEIPAHYQRIP